MSFHQACCATLALLWGMAAAAAPGYAAVLYASDVFMGGAEGPQGTSNYRIPGLTVAPDGSLLAFAEGRRSNVDPGQAGFPIDLVMKRSTDGGQTWGPLMVLAADPAFDYDDPTPIVDASTGGVHLLYSRVPDDCGLGCVPAGLSAESMSVFQRTSADNGQSWAAPINITSQVKDPSWRGIVAGPGSGIQLRWQDSAPARNGRLVAPASINANRNLVLYSDDHGASWRHGALAQDDLGLGGSFNGNENEVVELTNGDLLMNARPNGGSARRMFRSRDGGDSWVDFYNGPSPITTVDASMIRYSALREGDDRDRILFAGPLGSPAGSGSGRSNIGMWTSYDEGLTFINPVQLGTGHAAYSVLTKLNDDTIGLIYEATGSTHIRYLNYAINQVEGASHDSNVSHFDGFGNTIAPLNGGMGWSGEWETTGDTSQALSGLEFAGMNVAEDMHRMQLAGGELTRSLGASPIDLSAEGTHFVSLFVRSDDDGADVGSQEFFDVDLLSGSATAIAFGVGSAENFALRMGANPVASSGADSFAIGAVYFLIAKIETSDAGDDQVQLAWYDSLEALPADEASVDWGLARVADLSGVIDSLRLSGGANAVWNVDALRVGATLDSVVFTDGQAPDILGDFTADGMITLADWLRFKQNFGTDTSGLTIPAQQDLGDIDADGAVDMADFAQFRAIFDAAIGVGAVGTLPASVPEPSSVTLLLAAVVALAARPHRG